LTLDVRMRKAVVTGSTRGVGYAIARGLAEQGVAVVLNGRTHDQLLGALERLRREVAGAQVIGVAADLSTASGANALVERIPDADILVNNAGMYAPKDFFEITDEEWEAYFQLNVMAAVRLSRHYARGMIAKRWGRLLFNASITGGFMNGEMAHYGATKAALLGLSRTLAEQLAGSGVTANSFIPGPILTERSAAFVQEHGRRTGEHETEFFGRHLPASLLKRFIRPTEIADFVVFLASDQASAITGSGLRVDGGIVRSLL
jgi:NAD(P)-dependent dehydrogenase (short-subunit alcohol dehydrogenase family)